MAALCSHAAVLAGATNSPSATRRRFISDSPGPQPEGLTPRKKFPKSARVLRSSDFRTIYDGGKRFSSPYFSAFYLADAPSPGPRIGFTTPRAIGRAIVRNLAKRRFREAVRLHLDELSPTWSVVLNPRRSSLTIPFPTLELEILKLFRYLSSKFQHGSSVQPSAYIK